MSQTNAPTSTQASERYAIRLSNGQWYHGRDDSGAPKWTRVPSWAVVITDPVELAEVLEYLEGSEHDYTLLAPKD